MHPRTKFRLKFTAAFAACVVLFGWLVGGESSPFSDFFRGGELREVWGLANLLPVIVAAVIEGNPHSWSESVFFVAFVAQWLVVGYLLSGPVSKLTSGAARGAALDKTRRGR